MADDPDHQVRQPRRQRPRRLLRAFSSPDSYGLVLLLIVATYTLSAATPTTWAASLVLFVQIATIWVTLRASQAAAASARSPPPSWSSRRRSES